MRSGICTLSIVPCRKEPSGTSEMVTQLLFGEHYRILESSGDWLRIRTAFEDYPCWISAKQHSRLSEQGYHALEKASPVYAGELLQKVENELNKTSYPIPLGASLSLCQV